MRKENAPGKLREAMVGALRGLAEKNAQLAGLVRDELSDNGLPSLPEVIAALGMISELASAGKTILAESGVIFDGKSLPESEMKLEERISPPKTFGELLRLRIDESLPAEVEQFKKKDLLGFSGSVSRTRGAIKDLGLSGQKLFSREQVIEVVEKTLTSSGKVEVGQKDYNYSRLGNAFRVSREQLDEWSRIVGHNWRLQTRVDKETALAIRGLAVLDKLTKKP